MQTEEKEIIKNTIKDVFLKQEKLNEFKLTSDFNLLLSQLDLFRVISTIVVAIIGFSYFENFFKINKDFLLVSFIFSIITLLISISYSREVIDLYSNKTTKEVTDIEKEGEEIISKALESLEQNNFSIFKEYAHRKVKKEEKPSSNLLYSGEIVLLSFYLALVFLLLSYLSVIFEFKIISCPTVVSLILVYLLAFKNWSDKAIRFLSKKIK